MEVEYGDIKEDVNALSFSYKHGVCMKNFLEINVEIC